jgi:hypothetical protein
MTNKSEVVSDAFEAWNRCSLTDEQLDVVIDSLASTIQTLTCIGGGGLLIGSIYQLHSSATWMKEQRKKDKS